MTTRDEFLSIADRCEKAEGPSREIDWAIVEVIGKAEFYLRYAKQPLAYKGLVPLYTRSIDAITALIERELPGWAWKMGTCSVSDDAWIVPDFNCPVHGARLADEIGPYDPRSIWDHGIDIDRRPPGNVALALCEAFCRAMAERAE